MYCKELTIKLDRNNFLGKGLFSKAYRVGEEVVVVTSDPAKECLALFTDESIHLPRLTVMENIGEKQVYRMPYYEKLSPKFKDAWSQYKLLKKAIDIVICKHPGKYRCYEVYRDLIENCAGLKQSIKEAIFSILDNMPNYTDNIFIEVSPRNLKVDRNGELILLDIVGDTNLLKIIRGRSASIS